MLAVGCGDSNSSLFFSTPCLITLLAHDLQCECFAKCFTGFFLEATLGPHMVGTLLWFSLGYRFFSQVFLKCNPLIISVYIGGGVLGRHWLHLWAQFCHLELIIHTVHVFSFSVGLVWCLMQLKKNSSYYFLWLLCTYRFVMKFLNDSNRPINSLPDREPLRMHAKLL